MSATWVLIFILAVALVLVRRPDALAGVVRGLRASPLELALAVLLTAGLLWAVTGGAIPVGWALVALLVGVAFVGRDLLANYVDGVSIRWARDFERGDTLEVEGRTGVVAEITRRGVILEDDRGRVLIPHRRLTQAIVHQRRAASGALPHRFELTWPEGLTYDEIQAVVVRAALMNPWVVPGRRPEIERLAPTKAVVTVYSVDPARVFEVERTIREALPT